MSGLPPLLLLLLLLLDGSAAERRRAVFQGSCASEGWRCEQICEDLEAGIFACSCRPRFQLLPDGASCRSLSSRIHDLSPEKTQRRPAIESSKAERSTSNDGRNALAFNGASVAGFASPASAYLQTNLSLRIRSAQPPIRPQLLLFAGQHYGADFLSVSLEKDRLILRFDCGEGTVEEVFESEELSKGGVWHRLRVHRHFCDEASLGLEGDQGGLEDSTTLTRYKGISMGSHFFLGGVPEEWREHALEKSNSEEFFNGCVSFLEINGDVLLDTESGVAKTKLKENLDVCGGSWSERENEGDAIGALRDSAERIDKPHLDGFGHLSFAAPPDLDEYFSIRIRIKPASPDGLLFFSGSPAKHLALFLRNGSLYFQFSLGRGPALLRSQRPLRMNSWNLVEAWRTGRGSLMKITDQDYVEGLAPESETTMEEVDLSKVVIGGPGEFPNLPVNLRDLPGYEGCLNQLVVNDVQVDLTRPLSASRVRDCDADPCRHSPCNGETCVREGDAPLCLCPLPKAGLNCDARMEPFHGPIAFDRSSRLFFNQSVALRRLTSRRLDLELAFRLEATSLGRAQTLLFAGAETKAGDELRLSVDEESQLRLELQLGSGRLDMTHSLRLAAGVWHRLALHRHGRKVTLILDGKHPTTAQAPAPSAHLNVYEGFHLGGERSRPLGGFHGCIRHLRLGTSLRIDNVEQATEAVNVGPCRSLA